MNKAETDLEQQNEPSVPKGESIADAELIRGSNFTLVGVILELALVMVALLLAWALGLYAREQPLADIDGSTWSQAIKWGLIGLIPLVVYLLVYIYCPPKFLIPMREVVDTYLKPLIETRSIFELVLLAFLAGFCEELLFRWSLQGGLAHYLGSVPIAILLSSILFGFCHYVNASYGISTGIIGIYLGVMMVYSGTWLAPAITHMLFDLMAFLYIKYSSSQSDLNGPNTTLI